jgi:hypothetical protein
MYIIAPASATTASPGSRVMTDRLEVLAEDLVVDLVARMPVPMYRSGERVRRVR